MSLYRTYRPKTFADVVGQDHIVTTLATAVDQNKLAHAYLFAGTRGTGKTSTARILAKALLTHGIADETVKKHILQAVDEGNLVDLTEIDAASNTGVDNIRDLIEKIQFTPVVAAAKVYIIDEVHMLSKGAFNALLKTLEEPPSYAYFILATTELHKIPATIQSRCQRFLFRQINEADLVNRLQYIADQERIQVEEAALKAIAHHVQGGMRDAISLLDQLRSLPTVTLQDVKERVGETGHEYVEQVFAAVQSGDRSVMIRIVKSLEETGVPLENFVRLLLDSVRLRLHAAIKQNESTEGLESMLHTFLSAVRDLRAAPVPGLVLESALLSLSGTNGGPAPGKTAPTPEPTAPATPTSKPTAPIASAPSASSSPAPAAPSVPVASATGTVSAHDLRKQWPDIVQKVDPASARMSLKDGQPYTLEDDLLTIRFSSSFHKDKASTTEASHSLEKAIAAVTGRNIRMQFVLSSDLSAPPPIAAGDAVDLAAAAMDVF